MIKTQESIIYNIPKNLTLGFRGDVIITKDKLGQILLFPFRSWQAAHYAVKIS